MAEALGCGGGLGSMIGAGIFAALALSRVRGRLLFRLAVAAVVAYCSAISSARLAALPGPGAPMRMAGCGWATSVSFVVGKTASCAAHVDGRLSMGSAQGTRWPSP